MIFVVHPSLGVEIKLSMLELERWGVSGNVVSPDSKTI